MFKGKNILVAGGAGFIGKNLIARLATKGCYVRATFHNALPVIKAENIEYVQADLTVLADCQRVVQGMDYVFMCAANTSGAAVIAQTPLVHVTSNIVMNAQMLESAYNAKVRKYLFISSSIVYPPTGGCASLEEEWLKDDPYETYYGAGWMKRYGEILCKIYSEKLAEPMPSVVVRPSNVYGPHDKFDFKRSHVTAALLKKVVERHDPLEVWGTGEDVRDLIYIDDFIDGTLLAFEKVDGYNPINLAYGKGYSVKEILHALLSIDHFGSAQVIFNTSKPSTIPIRLVDTTKAKKILGFSAQTPLEEGLKKTMQWYRENAGLGKNEAICRQISAVI
jgi:GDP-L-fucose synthase